MKVNYTKILLLTIACVGLSAGLVNAAKPSLSGAKRATTVGELLKVIQAASEGKKGGFFILDTSNPAQPNSIGVPFAETMDLTRPVGILREDSAQIAAIKNALSKSTILNKKTIGIRNIEYKTVDDYQKYLLYFQYAHTDGNVYKLYINDPWPQIKPGAINQIMKKWKE